MLCSEPQWSLNYAKFYPRGEKVCETYWYDVLKRQCTWMTLTSFLYTGSPTCGRTQSFPSRTKKTSEGEDEWKKKGGEARKSPITNPLPWHPWAEIGGLFHLLFVLDSIGTRFLYFSLFYLSLLPSMWAHVPTNTIENFPVKTWLELIDSSCLDAWSGLCLTTGKCFRFTPPPFSRERTELWSFFR